MGVGVDVDEVDVVDEDEGCGHGMAVGESGSSGVTGISERSAVRKRPPRLDAAAQVLQV